jgi:catechol 2,3-dioxygenase-like lactoylglutathione lyase family enzyme
MAVIERSRAMKSSVVFLAGLFVGGALATGFAQGQKLAPVDNVNYVNHVGFAVENFDEAFNFYTQKMGFREAFTVKDAAGKPQLAYVQVSRNTFVEIQQANANRRPGLNHFGLHVENLKNVVASLKERGVTVDDVRVRPDDSSVANATDPNGIRIEMFEFGPGSPQGKSIAAWK